MTKMDEAIDIIRRFMSSIEGEPEINPFSAPLRHIAYTDKAAKAFNAGISALSTDFDENDESTWPKSKYAPSRSLWVVHGVDGCISSAFFEDGCFVNTERMTFDFQYVPLEVLRYADTVDFLPKEKTPE